MLKKIVLGVVVVGLTGVLVAGAAWRTIEKTSQTSESHSEQGHARGGQNALEEHTGHQGGNQEALVEQTERQGGGRGSGQDRESVPGETAGEGEAHVEAWLTREGAIVALDDELLTVELDGGDLLEIEGRAWSFAQEQGFTAITGDRLLLMGFFEEDGRFEVGRIANLTTGQTVFLREDTGRPLWSGRGRRGV
ncbi:MAG: hypothetical protein JW910_16415 [Anaerolineae bacterium]|nr:hypothetical protein [Anaerolineae bacterium]